MPNSYKLQANSWRNMEEEEGLKPKYSLAVSVEAGDNGSLLLKLPDGTMIGWPKEFAPEEINGAAYLELVTLKVLEHRKRDLAREVLLRILNIGREE